MRAFVIHTETGMIENVIVQGEGWPCPEGYHTESAQNSTQGIGEVFQAEGEGQ